MQESRDDIRSMITHFRRKANDAKRRGKGKVARQYEREIRRLRNLLKDGEQ